LQETYEADFLVQFNFNYFILLLHCCWYFGKVFCCDWIAVVHPKEKPPINVVGDVAGHIAIVVVCHLVRVFCFFFFQVLIVVNIDWVALLVLKAVIAVLCFVVYDSCA